MARQNKKSAIHRSSAKVKKPATSWSIANTITLLRILTTPVILWLLFSGQILLGSVIFTLSILSDFMDGWLARRMNQQSELGARLDAGADKLLLVTVYIFLSLYDYIDSWLMLVVVGRDVFLLLCYSAIWLVGVPMRTAPLYISKVNTVVQSLWVIGVLGLELLDIKLATVEFFFSCLVAGTTIFSGMVYVFRGLQDLYLKAR